SPKSDSAKISFQPMPDPDASAPRGPRGGPRGPRASAVGLTRGPTTDARAAVGPRFGPIGTPRRPLGPPARRSLRGAECPRTAEDRSVLDVECSVLEELRSFLHVGTVMKKARKIRV